MTSPFLTIAEIGEQGLLQRLYPFCSPEMVGDDAAILDLAPGKSLVVTTDLLVDGVHFSEKTATPEDVGWRAAAANLSDLAGMGASGLGITVGLSLPGQVAVDWVDRLYQGLTACLQKYDMAILGGDICRSPTITVAITALGQILPGKAIRRSTARPGDAIAVTGFHGSSRAGLELLLQPELGQNLAAEALTALIRAHQRPQPRLDVLEPLWAVAGNQSVAGMDSSDGLADAVIQICRLSGTGATLTRQSIPLSPALQQFVPAEQALAWSLYGGEDFELVLCLPEKPALALVSRLGDGAAIVGKITAGTSVELLDREGIHPPQTLTLTEGFQHF